QDGGILLTGNSALPLIRYAVGDHGGVFSMDEAREKFKLHHIDFEAEARRANVPVEEMPFVYVYERSDFSVKLYGAIIYPEHIREGLAHRDLRKLVTGKFTMTTKLDKNHDSYLEISIEMKKDVKPSKQLTHNLQRRIIESLLKRNAEYANNYSSIPRKMA